jgi:hypothetical protein
MAHFVVVARCPGAFFDLISIRTRGAGNLPLSIMTATLICVFDCFLHCGFSITLARQNAAPNWILGKSRVDRLYARTSTALCSFFTTLVGSGRRWSGSVLCFGPM